ncbi:hypothetical protein FSP39_014980 [Pinctada imbricata]|uniref:Uncharacterized protein n=1 Tax=Pinctada imbricata TaxID=66713 RepID=A0AA88XMF1_PINIB|nr:hypothetical protein FSP39_014980 [Pinctada imbricata]
MNISEVLYVNASFFAVSIVDFDDVSGIISLVGGINLVWNDPRLTWTPSDHSNIQYAILKRSLLWTPDIFVINPADDLKGVADDTFLARFDYSGNVIVTLGDDIKVLCSSDMSFFPFDVQECSVVLGAWGYFGHEIYLKPLTSTIDLTYFSKSNIWDVDSTSVAEVTYGAYSGYLKYTLKLRRKPLFFTLTILAPVFILGWLTPLVFLLPAESGDRMGYCVTIFLSFAVFLSVLSDDLPKASTPMAYVCYIVSFAIIHSAFVTVVTLLNQRLHHSESDEMAGKRLSRLVYFAGFKFMKGRCDCKEKSSSKVYDTEKVGSTVTLKAETTWELETCRELAHKMDSLLFIYNMIINGIVSFAVLVIFAVAP